MPLLRLLYKATVTLFLELHTLRRRLTPLPTFLHLNKQSTFAD